MERYNKLNSFLKNKFGQRVLKICIDGGFTCPNRDGVKGFGGCAFCSECGSGEHIKEKDIESKIKQHLQSYRGERANKFIAYFQNFSNTYSDIENLRKKYDIPLKFKEIVGLSIATRPDCITEEIAQLLSEYNKKIYTYVELGLQTINTQNMQFLNLQYTTQDFINAVKILNKYNIDIVVHIMVGLPNENLQDIKNTIEFLNQQKINGVKIHSTYVVKNTKLQKLFLENKYTPITLEEYIQSIGWIISHIRKDIVIHRISGDAPKDILVAPEWNAHKKWIINGIDKFLREHNIMQGDNSFE